MAKVKTYGELQDSRVESFVENHKYESVTEQAVFDASKLEHPEGITNDSLLKHLSYVTDLTGVTETAGAQILRDLHAQDDKALHINASLSLPGFTINTQHDLKREVGDDAYYGISTTMVDYSYTDEATEWLAEQRSNNETLAAKLFS